MKYSTLALFAALSLASAPALAERGGRYDRGANFQSAEYAAVHEALEERDDLLQRRSTTFRIGAIERREIAKERREIRDLQDRLEDGEAIDGFTLYRALGSEQHILYFKS